MPVDADTEVVRMRAANMSDTPASNGGRMSNSVIASDVKQNIFPNASQAQRIAGATQVRKVFWKNVNADDIAMEGPKAFVYEFTAGADAVVIHEGTQTDIESGLTGNERVYGCGQLNQDTASDAMSIEVLVEDDALDIFNAGDLLIVFSVDTGDEITQFEFVRIPNITDPVVTYVGDVATITLETPLQQVYDNAVTRVASVLEADDIVASLTDPVVTSGAGTFNSGSNPMLAHNVGGIEQNWTAVFSSPTAFTVSGDTVGSVGSGTVGTDFAPNNPGTGTPYFTIDHLAFGGTFANGNTITWTTHPAALPIWYHRIIPAGAAQFTNDAVEVAVDYESA